MTFFIDANVLIYSAVPDGYQDACLEIVRAVAAGSAPGRTSASALEEVWHVETSGRGGQIAGLTRQLYTVLTPLLPVTDEAFRLALSVRAPGLAANDRLHIGT